MIAKLDVVVPAVAGTSGLVLASCGWPGQSPTIGLTLSGAAGVVGAAAWACRRMKRASANSAERACAEQLENLEELLNIAPPETSDDEGALVEYMLAQGRSALLVRPQIAVTLASGDLRQAMEAFDKRMAVVPAGEVVLHAFLFHESEEDRPPPELDRVVDVEGLYLDRHPVTNLEFHHFVAAGGYEQPALWDPEILPGVLQFLDRTGLPGPRFWREGRFAAGEAEHPVVGVCWYEAAAFAHWVGKRLPTDAEWVKAASWPISQPGSKPIQRRFPWGDTMDRNLANLWGSGLGHTASVHDFDGGASVGGIHQLIGNVWEWTSTNFGHWYAPKYKLELPVPMKSLRGGAFDTYFDHHAQNAFQSGDSLLARKHNIGFRCAVGACDVMDDAFSQPYDLEETSEDCQS